MAAGSMLTPEALAISGVRVSDTTAEDMLGEVVDQLVKAR